MKKRNYLKYVLAITVIIAIAFMYKDIYLYSDSNNISFKYKDKSETFSIANLKNTILFEDIPRTVPGSYKIISYSNSILNDTITVLSSLDKFYKPISEINWKENPFNNSTWELYYQNLFFVSTLNHAFQETKDIRYHNKAKDYIISYISFLTNHDKKTKLSKYSWYDHSVAFRTLHILQTISTEINLENPDIEFVQSSFNHISDNITFMIDSKHYRVHNHSLMMDRTLLYLANALSFNEFISTDIRELSSNRALNNFNRIISDAGLAKEHSTTYHIFNHNLYKSIFQLTGNDNIETSVLLKYLKMNDILLQLVKPDLTFPLWGDSQVEKLTAKLVHDFGDDERLYSVLKGKNTLKSNIDFENNIATLRTKTKDKGHLTLFANYMSRTHKHHDDLSFIFQTLGIDVFTDQGYYGYEKKYKPILSSVFSHNTVVLNEKDYKLGKEGQYSKIVGYINREDYEIIEAEHNLYENILINRKLLFIHPNVIIIRDMSEGKNKTTNLTQIFNLGEELKSIEIKNNKAFASFENNLSVTLNSINKKDELIEKTHFRSKRPFNIVETKQFILKSDSNIIESIIVVKSKEYKYPISDVVVKNGIVFYNKKGVSHKISF